MSADGIAIVALALTITACTFGVLGWIAGLSTARKDLRSIYQESLIRAASDMHRLGREDAERDLARKKEESS